MSAETRCFFVTVFNVNPHARRAYSVRHDIGFAGYFARNEISCAVPSAQSAAASFVQNISDAGVSCIILYRYKRTVTGIGLILTGCFCIVSAAVTVIAESTELTALLLGILPALIVPIKRDHASAIASAGLIPVVSEMLRALFEMLNLGYGTVRLGSFTSDVQLLGVLVTAATAQTLLILSPNGYGEEKI